MRKRDRIKLYPNHQHQWAGVHARDCAVNAEDVASLLGTNFTPPPRCDCTPQAQCTVCDLEMPRNVVEAYDEPSDLEQDLRTAIAALEAAPYRPSWEVPGVAIAPRNVVEAYHDEIPTVPVLDKGVAT